jgi:membrane protein DedA with SNARE-associated domain
MNETAEFVIRHGYAVLFFWILAEQGALPIPSVPLLLVCGALAKTGRLRAEPILFLGVLACLIADGSWFQLGRTRGKKVLGFLCRVALEPDSCVRQTENGFIRYGVRFLLVSKFIPGMNALAAPLAGSARVGWSQFLLFDTLGAALFVSAWGTVGYLFSNQLEDIGFIVGRAGEDVVIIDVRGMTNADGPIPGALRIPLSELAARHDEVPRDRDVVLFCSCPNEASAARAALLLRKYGITRVRPLEGGADAWLQLTSVT